MLMHWVGLCAKAVRRAVPLPRRGRVPPAPVCMADCIKHKQLYLIGLYPALITTNSQSLWTALLAPATLQNKQGKSHSSVILNRAERDDGDGVTMTILMIGEHMQRTFTIIAIINCITEYDDDDRTQFIITVIVTMVPPEGKGDLDLFIASAM